MTNEVKDVREVPFEASHTICSVSTSLATNPYDLSHPIHPLLFHT